MEKELVEKLDTRRKLIAIIRSKPGIHFREIQRESDYAMGELEYHLNVLEKMEIITVKKNTHYTKYYLKDQLGSADKQIMWILRQESLREILVYIISNESVSHGDIVREFHLVKSTASFYLEKLLKAELVTKTKKGRSVYYNVRDPKKILSLILTYKSGFGDELANRVSDLWANL